jgi:peptidyl-prolyl cis-trans isomerase SurA
LFVNKALYAAALVMTLTAPAGAEILERVLVKVNGEILTKTELEQRQIFALRQRNPQLREQDVQSDETLRKMLAEVTPDVLMGAIDEMLLLQRGKELGLRLADEQFSAIIANIKKENRLETEEQFQAALKQEGMTLDDLRRSIERRMIIDRVQQMDVLQKVSITEEDAKKYYAAHPEEFTTPASVTLREILIAVPESVSPTGEKGITAAQDEAAEARIQEVRRRVTSGGEDFGRVASEVSDAPSKANGGLIGPIVRTELAPALQKLLTTMKPGEVTEPIRTPRGYQVIKLESTSADLQQPFEEVRDAIADKVFESKRRGEVERYLARLRSEAIIEWNSDELRQMYEQRVKASPVQTGA